MLFQFGKWKIEIDKEETRKYYEDLKFAAKDTEAWNNYCVYLEHMKPDEKRFFNNLGILPYKCDVESLGYLKKVYPTYGRYLVKGRYLTVPEENSMPIEEFLTEEIFEEEVEEEGLHIGLFAFEFLRENGMFNPAPTDLPEGYLGPYFARKERAL